MCLKDNVTQIQSQVVKISELQEVFTESGDVTVVMELEEGKLQTNIVTSEKEIDKIEAHLRAIKQLQLKE